MRHTSFALAMGFLLTSAAPILAGVHTIYSVNGNTPADIQGTVDTFREALGPNNGNAPVNGPQPGRRQINWDAAPDFISDPNPFPGNFFNFPANPRARGIEFKEVGSTTGFELSSTAASGEPVAFDNPTAFVPFSPERMFRPVGGDTFDVAFFDPARPSEPSLTHGLGVVFNDVQDAGETTMSFYDRHGDLLYEDSVKTGATGSLSFLGVTFTQPEVARVRIKVGSLFSGGSDAVVMDDFIFGEPIAAAVPLPASSLLLPLGLAVLGGLRRRR